MADGNGKVVESKPKGTNGHAVTPRSRKPKQQSSFFGFIIRNITR
jgi:hypothetical protein